MVLRIKLDKVFQTSKSVPPKCYFPPSNCKQHLMCPEHHTYLSFVLLIGNNKPISLSVFLQVFLIPVFPLLKCYSIQVLFVFVLLCYFEHFVPQRIELIILFSSWHTIIGPCKERPSCFMSSFLFLFKSLYPSSPLPSPLPPCPPQKAIFLCA